MDRILYVAASGAKQISQAQVANSHNLANASTTGFQADVAAFRALPVHGPGQASRVYAQAETVGVDFSRGSLESTGRDLDVAVNGKGLIAIQSPDGGEAFTRAGELRVTNAGQLVTGAGHPVLGEGGPIALPPFQKLTIGADGTISLQPLGQAGNSLAVVDRIKLVNPKQEEMHKGIDGLLRLNSGAEADADAGVQLISGALESSNVNAVQSMVNMIELARAYEMHVKLMKTVEENDAASARLMQLS